MPRYHGGWESCFEDVIHAVGPRYHQDLEPERLLESAYRNSLELALEHDCCSIAFPAISCGAYRFPAYKAARISLRVCGASKFAALEIQFWLFTDELVETWEQTNASMRYRS